MMYGEHTLCHRKGVCVPDHSLRCVSPTAAPSRFMGLRTQVLIQEVRGEAQESAFPQGSQVGGTGAAV
jgi:hypothetical protein